MPIDFNKYGTPVTQQKSADFSKYGTVLPAVPEKPKENIAVGFAKGVGKEAVSFTAGLSGLGEKITRAITPKVVENFLLGEKQEKSIAEQFIPEKYRVASTPAQKAGMIAAQIGEFFIPGGTTAKTVRGAETAIQATRLAPKAQKVLELVARSGILGAESAAVTAAQTGGDLKKIAEAGITGAVIPPVLTGATKVIGKGLTKLAERTPTTRLQEMTRNLRTLQNVYEEGTKRTNIDGKIIESNPIKTLGELKLVPGVIDNKVDATKIIESLDTEIEKLAKPRTARLKVSDKTADLVDFETDLIGQIRQSKELKSAGLVNTTIKKAEAIIDDFRSSYGNQLPVEALDDIRRVMNKRFDPELRDVFRAIGDTARKYVYKLDEASRPTLLREGQLIAARDFAEALNNRVVKGGRLGGYVNQVLGAIVGSSLQIPVAGPLIGALGGKQLDDLIRQSYFKVPGSQKAQQLLKIAEKIRGTRIGTALFGSGEKKVSEVKPTQLLLPPGRGGSSSIEVPINLPRRSQSTIDAAETARNTGKAQSSSNPNLFYKNLAENQTKKQPVESLDDIFNDIPFMSPKEELAVLNETLATHPGKELYKYANKISGELPEALGKGKGKYNLKGDDLAKTAKFEDEQAAQEAVYDYRKLLKQREELEGSIKGTKEVAYHNDLLSQKVRLQKKIRRLEAQATESEKYEVKGKGRELATARTELNYLEDEMARNKESGIAILDKELSEAGNPLTQEAKKYKSAEEFVKAQQKKLSIDSPFSSDGNTSAIKLYKEAYGADMYKTINADLRTGKYNPLAHKLELEIQEIEPYTGTVYRGGAIGGKSPKELKVGDLIEEKAFTSTSNRKSVAQKRTKDIFEIESVNGKYIGDGTFADFENEILFRPGSKFKVTAVEKKPNGDTITKLIEVVGKEDKSVTKSQLTDIWNKANRSNESGSISLKALLGLGVGSTALLATQGKRQIDFKNPSAPQESQKPVPPPLRIENKTYKPAIFDAKERNALDIAYQSNPDLKKGYLESLLAIESPKGGISEKKKDIFEGKYGYLVGFEKKTADNIRKKQKEGDKRYTKIPLDFSTPKDALLAAAAYSSFKNKEYDSKGNVTKTFDDPEKLWLDRYNANKEYRDRNKKVFNYLYNYYKPESEEDNNYSRVLNKR